MYRYYRNLLLGLFFLTSFFFLSVFYIDVHAYISDVRNHRFSFDMLSSIISEHIVAGYCILAMYSSPGCGVDANLGCRNGGLR